MKFVLDERKSAHAAAFLIRLNGGELALIRLLKLLYLADRKELEEVGLPITGDQPYSLPKGPTPSHLYNIMKANDPDANPEWFAVIERRGEHTMAAVDASADLDELSEYDRRVLTAIYERFGGMRWTELSAFLHALPEWIDPHGSSQPIRVETILESANWTPAKIEQAVGIADELWQIDTAARRSS